MTSHDTVTATVETSDLRSHSHIGSNGRVVLPSIVESNGTEVRDIGSAESLHSGGDPVKSCRATSAFHVKMEQNRGKYAVAWVAGFVLLNVVVYVVKITFNL